MIEGRTWMVTPPDVAELLRPAEDEYKTRPSRNATKRCGTRGFGRRV